MKEIETNLILLQNWCVDNSDYDKEWYLELFFNRAYKERIEWGLGLSFGYSRDNISVGHNFFGDSPNEAIKKAIKNLDKLKDDQKKVD